VKVAPAVTPGAGANTIEYVPESGRGGNVITVPGGEATVVGGRVWPSGLRTVIELPFPDTFVTPTPTFFPTVPSKSTTPTFPLGEFTTLMDGHALGQLPSITAVSVAVTVSPDKATVNLVLLCAEPLLLRTVM
jgi:hypothetical protein